MPSCEPKAAMDQAMVFKVKTMLSLICDIIDLTLKAFGFSMASYKAQIRVKNYQIFGKLCESETQRD